MTKSLRFILSAAPFKGIAILMFGCVCAAMTHLAIKGHLGRRSPETIISDTVERLRKLDPHAADYFGGLDEERGKLAVAAQIRYSEQQGPRSSLDWLVTEYNSGRLETRQRLVTMMLDRRNGLLSDEDRSGFLAGHETLTDGLALMSPEAEKEYMDSLERLQGTADWGAVKDDPASLVIRGILARSNPELWDFYINNREWLRSPLSDIEAAESMAPEEVLVRVLQAAKDYHPLVEEAVKSLKFQVFGLLLFEEYGPLLKALRDHQVPLDQSLEVVYANQPDLPGRNSSVREREDKAVELATLRARKPTVWKLACQGSPAVLWLDSAVPECSEQVCQKYGDLDASVLLRTFYQEDVRLAAKSLVQFGDVAFYYLSEHAKHPDSRLRTLMRKPEVGIRVIPYVAKFGDKGIDQIEQDVRWLNEWFDAEGNEIRPPGQWLMDVPFVGAPAYVIDKFSHGRPLTGAEMGWAALDVADCVLLVASFGSSSAETAARKAAEVTGRQIVRGSGESALRSGVLEAVRSAVAKGIRATSRGPVLRGLIKAAEVTIEAGGQAVSKGRAIVRMGAGKVAEGVEAWNSVNPAIRRCVYRGLLGLSLAIVIKERTLPLLGDLDFGSQVGKFIAKTAVDISKSIAAGVVAGLRELQDRMAGKFPWEWAIVGLAWLFFGSAILRLFRTRRTQRV